MCPEGTSDSVPSVNFRQPLVFSFRTGLLLTVWAVITCPLAVAQPSAEPTPAPASTAGPTDAAPIQVMILGTVHFDNPGLDLHNVRVDDVRTPAKQAELQAVADRLARFPPPLIVVEALSDRPDLVYEKFTGFTPAALTQNADERVQIGFRLARQLGLPVVYGVDEQSDTVDYFPFDRVQTYAKEHGGPAAARLEEFDARLGAMVKATEAAQKTLPLRLVLAELNEPAKTLGDHRAFYYGLLTLGDAKTQPGADLNGGWYLRNAKIFAKLAQVAKPGDRVLVVFGGGHKYWLQHFARETPGFVVVEPGEYLR